MQGRILSHYLIEERLGAGGMGEVYRARDLALGRMAAIKLLPEGFAPVLRERLLREAEASSRFQHPAIATFYESGQDGDTVFLAMEYVPGVTLRERIRRGPLPAAEAVATAACLLEALAHAHAAGVLHRDIKPENIMMARAGCPKLLDFGLAKTESRSPAPTGTIETQLTALGGVPGTPGYLAPERIKGETADARSDLFGLGAVLYEMLSGKPAFPGANSTEKMASILTRDIDPLEGEGVPASLDRILKRALHRDPSHRYPSAGEFLTDLRTLAEGGVPVGLPDTLAVLDLTNLSRSPDSDWIGSGIAESLAADLTRAGIDIVPRQRILTLLAAQLAAGGMPDARQAGLALGCRWILSGSFQKMGSALRVLTSLLEVSTGRSMPLAKADGAVESVFAIQDSLAAEALRLLNRVLPPDRRAGAPAPELDAYEAYSRGRRLWNRLEKGSIDQAGDHYQRAIRISPEYGLALSGLAGLHAMRFVYTTDRAELERAVEFAHRAIAADPALAEPHVWLGYALFRTQRGDEALAEFARAMELDAANERGNYFAGVVLSSQERWPEALAMTQAAVEVDPNHGFAWLSLGWIHTETGRYAEAEWCYRQAISMEATEGTGPTTGAEGYLAEALRRSGDPQRARDGCLSAMRTIESKDHMYRDTVRAFTLCTLGKACIDAGDAEGARAAFRQAVVQLRGRPRLLGGGSLMVQALAGYAGASLDPGALREAADLLSSRREFDFSFFYGTSIALAEQAVARASATLTDAGPPEA